MSTIFVSGLINIETTLRVEAFPVVYHSARYPFFGINSSVSGVGFNVAKALTVLGDTIQLASLVGKDYAGMSVKSALAESGLTSSLVLPTLDKTPQSVILYDIQGTRAINTDLKDIQDAQYPLDHIPQVIATSDLAVICNVNFSRPMLALARQAGKLIATDVHALADIHDPYNQDFMREANLLFISGDSLWDTPKQVAKQLVERFSNELVVVGMGYDGALLRTKSGTSYHVPAVFTRPVVNTIGAGDALFSCFVHEFVEHGNPELALRRAVIFASYKIGVTGAADGFLSPQGLSEWEQKLADNPANLG